MPFRRSTRRRWIALVAAIGLLFQQFAMAAYVCPQQIAMITAVADAEMPPCHAGENTDPARCHEHCGPTTASADHATALTVPPAMLPATRWFPTVVLCGNDGHPAYQQRARSQPPPLMVQYCTFQI